MTLAATLTFISDRDHTLMRRVNRWHAPRWIRVWMLCATRGGDGWLWYAMGLAILLWAAASDSPRLAPRHWRREWESRPSFA
jgi:hypothetical protein